MFVKRFISKVPPEIQLPSGELKSSLLNPRLSLHHGLPASSSILAYDPVQRLLGIGTRDGRIKVFGGDGVEALLQSPTKSPCRFLQFITNTGRLLHVTTKNDIEVWDLDKREVVASLKWKVDITAVAISPGTSYVYLGDENGLLSVIHLKEDQILPMPYCVPVHATLSGIVKAGSNFSPSLVEILPHPDLSYPRLLLAYANGILVLWDLHGLHPLAIRGGTQWQRVQLAESLTAITAKRDHSLPRVLSNTNSAGGGDNNPAVSVTDFDRDGLRGSDDDEEEENEICSVCWASGNGSLAAVGYTNGDIRLWELPQAATSGPQIKHHGRHSESVSQTELAGALISGIPQRLIQLGEADLRVPVSLLRWCGGDGADGLGGGRLYVFGGGVIGLPEVVSVIPLHVDSEVPPGQLHLPWFGLVADLLMIPAAGFEPKASVVVVLTSPGQLHVYDEQAMTATCQATEGTPGGGAPRAVWQPEPLPFESKLAQSPVVAVQLVTGAANSSTMEILAQLVLSNQQLPPDLSSGSSWPISGGVPTKLPHDVVNSPGDDLSRSIYLTGHKNGFVNVWDVSTPALQLAASIPKLGGTAQAVSCLFFCHVSGLLVVGHDNGEVYLYGLSADACRVCRHTITKDEEILKEIVECEQGFQCLGVSKLHQVKVGAMALGTGPGRLAIGDDSGMVSVVDLYTFSVLFYAFCQPGPAAPISALAFAVLPFTNGAPTPSPHAASPPSTTPKAPGRGTVQPQVHETVLYVATSEGTLSVVEASSGIFAGATPSLQKNSHKGPVALHLLDISGWPLPAPLGNIFLPWAAVETSSDAYLCDIMAAGIADSHQSLPSVSDTTATEAKGGAQRSPTVGENSSFTESGVNPVLPLLPPSREVKHEGSGSGSPLAGVSLDNPGQPGSPGVAAVPNVDDPIPSSGFSVGAPSLEIKSPKVEIQDLLVEGLPSAHSVGPEPHPSPHAVQGDHLSPQTLGKQPTGFPIDVSKKTGNPFLVPDMYPQGLPSSITSSKEASTPIQSSSGTSNQAESPHSIPSQMLRPSPCESALRRLSSHDVDGEGADINSSVVQGPGPENVKPSILPNMNDFPEAHLVLLVTRQSILVYSTAALLQPEHKHLKKVDILEGKCVASCPFGVKDSKLPFGLILASSKGDLDIRSLPDLSPVVSGSLSNVLGWPYQPSATLRLLACTSDGRINMMEGDTELVRLSLFQDENTLRLPDSLPRLHDEVVAAAATTATEMAVTEPVTSGSVPMLPSPKASSSPSTNTQPPLTKRTSLGGKLLGSVKHIVVNAEKAVAAGSKLGSNIHMHSPRPSNKEPVKEPLPELPILFATKPFSLSADLSDEESEELEEKQGEINLPPLPSAASEPPAAQAPAVSHWNRIGSIFTRPEQEKHVDGSQPKDARTQLLSGGTRQNSGPPHQRTADEIKALYGHPKKTNDAAAAAAQARDKLLERGDKLRDMNRATEDMQNSAAEFGDLAAQLAKKYENRKWWEL